MRLIYDTFLFSILSTIIYFIFKISTKKINKTLWKTELTKLSFVFYISVLIFIILIYNTVKTDYLLYNFIPLKSILDYLKNINLNVSLKNLLGNIIIFFPLGFYFKFGFKIIPVRSLLYYSLIIPTVFESIQFVFYLLNIGMRTVDIDDVILNGLGIICGYYLSKITLEKWISSYNTNRSQRGET
ncbi:VanZ family protein [Paenibacillus sp. IB182496]|uniref:VanZ family protein n=1 Tax=Paenibacillus sabuli TaxID=2772509 RepID=A0A927BTA9_9BACL|nr:VanZ family protein [Paenibacillus sabuli]